MWAQHERFPHFFHRINVAVDGGLPKVKDLWRGTRYLYAAIVICLLVLNLGCIIYIDMKVVFPAPDDTDSVYSHARGLFNPVCESLERQVLTPHVSKSWCNSRKLLACIELLMLLIIGCSALRLVAIMICGGKVRRWHAVSYFFWVVVQEAYSLSAMRLLYFVTPTVVLTQFSAQVQGVITRKCSRWGWPLVRFCTTRSLAGLIGVEAFLIKFRETSIAYEHGNWWKWEWQRLWEDPFVITLIFLNQVLGAVQVHWFIRERILIFMFGGVDGIFEDKEKNLALTFHAMLAKKMWDTFSCIRFTALALSYGDYDFQYLVLIDEQPSSMNHMRRLSRPSGMFEIEVASLRNWELSASVMSSETTTTNDGS